jgi:hypothetical protein
MNANGLQKGGNSSTKTSTDQKVLTSQKSLVRRKRQFPRGSFPCRHPACSRQKAKPNANTRTLRPDKCLVVKSLDSSLRPVALRNMESTAITTRELKAGREGRFWGVNVVFRCRGGGAIRL